ncbi:hypothetical protein ISN45_Aa04g011750 [Arabidopsis thaliana x Arabidopsis arenosa]|uniref:Uncharacterized protein n=1 Tax=Arabidopsis thaliana x Arabidopsis arenosa TaxID=1240361 RepID=A0A8T2A9H0_9BRAS|nr:hypothetical protein ISN45_Aa04g011750 [Arabidopsis thaliana x Arabidopsis arenosa]
MANLNSGGYGIADEARRSLPCSKTHRRELNAGVELEECDRICHYKMWWWLFNAQDSRGAVVFIAGDDDDFAGDLLFYDQNQPI